MLSKNCIFVLTNNGDYKVSISYELWFAFKKLYLCSDEQLYATLKHLFCCCDLLSKNCIFVLTNNLPFFLWWQFIVVICFQKIVSLFWRTTPYNITSTFQSCDLLSKNCIFVLTNNGWSGYTCKHVVVICFQKIVSLFWRTTK